MGDPDYFKDSILYKIARAEKKEIDKLKWIESEKEGKDIGKDKAILIWILHHRDQWLKKFLKDNNYGP